MIKPSLNIGLWSKGIRHVPHKLRLRLIRRPDETEGNEGKFVSELELVQVPTFKGLVTEKEA